MPAPQMARKLALLVQWNLRSAPPWVDPGDRSCVSAIFVDIKRDGTNGIYHGGELES